MEEGVGALSNSVSQQDMYDATRVAKMLEERPSAIPSLLRELHNTKEDIQRFGLVEALAYLLNDTKRKNLWHVLATDGVEGVLMHVLRDELLCGYTSSELSGRYRCDETMQVRGLFSHCALDRRQLKW